MIKIDAPAKNVMDVLFKIQRMKDKSNRGLELTRCKIELRNRVTQNDATLPVTNSKSFLEIILSSC